MKITPISPKQILTALFTATLLPVYGASDLTNSLTGYSGNSQENGNGAGQPAFLTDAPASGLEVSKLAPGFTPAAAFETVFFNDTGAVSPEFPGVKFGGNRANNNDGRNYIRTVEADYNTKDFTAFVTVRRPAFDASNRRSVFFGIGTAAQLGGLNTNPDAGTTNAAAYFEFQNGFGNVSRRAQSNSQANVQINFQAMTPVVNDNSIRLRLQFNSVARTLILSADYGYVPGDPFTADQTFFTANPTTFTNQGNEWAAGDRASIFFGGDRGVVFTDFVVQVASPPTPPIPTGLNVASLASGTVNLQWVTPVAISGTTYSVYRSTTAGVFTDPAIATGLTTTSYSDTSAVNGTTYFYRVTQSNTVAVLPESSPSNEISATPVAGVITPSGVIAVNGGKNAVVVDWADLLSPFSSYTVRKSTAAGGPFTIPSGGSGLTESRYLDTNVVDGTTYYYTVSSVLGASESDQSAEVSAASKALEVFVDFNNGTPTFSGAGAVTAPAGTSWNGIGLGAVANLSDSSSSLSSVGLNVTGGGAFSKANGFNVGGDNTTPGSATLTAAGGLDLMVDYLFINAAGTTTTYTLTGLVPDRKYDLYLYGYGDVLGQNTLFGANGNLKQTSNPAGLTTLTEGRHYVTFTTVADLSGNVAFTWRNSFGTGDADANSGSALINGFQLVENSAAVIQPTGLVATSSLSGVGLTWDVVLDTTGYKIYRSSVSASGYALIGSVTGAFTNSFSDTTGVAGTTYYYVVTALGPASTESFFSGQASGFKELPLIVDTDLDGLSDSDEALLGTNPNSSSDFFKAQSSTVTRNGANYDIAIAINGAPGTYVIERSTTLLTGSWTEIAGSSQNFTWSSGTVLTNTLNLSATGVLAAPGGKEFFRARGVVPPAAP